MSLIPVRSTLSLLFDRGEFNDGVIDFARASQASYFDKNGVLQVAPVNTPRLDYDPLTGELKGFLVEESRTNLFTYSEEFIKWGLVNVNIKPNSEIAPNGKISADSMVVSGASGEHRVRFSASMAVSTSYTVSCYVKKITSRYVYIRDLTNNGDSIFDLDNGVVVKQGTGSSASIYDVGTYYRIIISFTTPASITNNLIDIGVTSSSTSFSSTMTIGDSFAIWGAQLEQGSFPTSYIPPNTAFTSRASTATYFDANGVLQTAGVDVARDNAYGFVDGKITPIGLLLEEARTNLLPVSEEFTNGAWDNFNNRSTINNGWGLDIFGTGNGFDRFLANDTAECRIDEVVTVTSGIYTASFYAYDFNNTFCHFLAYSASNNSGARQWFNLQTGEIGGSSNFGSNVSVLSAGMENLGSGVYRCYAVIDFGYTDFTFGIGLGNANLTTSSTVGQYIYISGAQLEQGSYPTSYIPTSGSAVTRSADVSSSSAVTRSADNAVIDGQEFLDFYNQEEGTWIAVAKPFTGVTAGSSMLFQVYTDANDRYSVYSFNDRGYIYYQVDSGVVSTVTPIEDKELNEVKIAITQPEKGKFFIDGVEQELNQNNEIPVHSLSIGFRGYSASSYFNGHIKRIVYFPKALSDADLQALTSQLTL